MSLKRVNVNFWSGKKVFLTGHTGFKGGWLALWLTSMGANVEGYSLAPKYSLNLYDTLKIGSLIEKSHIGDIRDLSRMQNIISEAKPEVIIHMAAQPLVHHSYVDPVETYSTNVMGTINVLECMRHIDSTRATLVVTTDKCYENKRIAEWNYSENDAMGGYDPYSSSKGCAELVTAAYRQSFFSHSTSINKIATARAGNVIGGGDWSENRLIPDAIKSFEAGVPLMIRNPLATRPWQHVLESLSGYLILTQALFERGDPYASSWNFGPNTSDNRSVQEVIELFISSWTGPARWEKEGFEHPHEEKYLSLDCSKARLQLGWTPKWNLETAVHKIVQWQSAYQASQDMKEFSLNQINHYMEVEE